MKAIDNVIDNLESFINKQTNKVKQRVRDRAVKNAETALILAGRKLHDLTPEEWEHICLLYTSPSPRDRG